VVDAIQGGAEETKGVVPSPRMLCDARKEVASPQNTAFGVASPQAPTVSHRKKWQARTRWRVEDVGFGF
jgi:hypothetical protein